MLGEVRIREIEEQRALVAVVRLLTREHEHRERVDGKPPPMHDGVIPLEHAQREDDGADDEEERGEILDEAAFPHDVLPEAAEERLRPVLEDHVDRAEDDRENERRPRGRHPRSTARQGEPSPPAMRSGRQ